ncbi:MAG: nucleotidyltransferase family protein [Anaerolineales bacterium]
MSFWTSLKHGPWPEGVAERTGQGLTELTRRLAAREGLVAVVVYGSYARSEAGRTSDLDLFILFELAAQLQACTQDVLAEVNRLETEARLPFHLAPLLASLDSLDQLGERLVQAIASEGIVLHGRLAGLRRLLPQEPTPAFILTFSLAGVSSAARMRLQRRLHGYQAWRTKDGVRRRVTYPGLLIPPARSLGAGALLLPGEQRAAVVEALTDAGAQVTEIPVWLAA